MRRFYRRAMTNLSSHIAVGSTQAPAGTTRDIGRRAFEITLGIAIVAALTGAWLTFFSFVPFDLTPHR
jgi:hypothetical protein